MPTSPNMEPKIPRRPKAINNASPATEGGRTMGRSINNSTSAFDLIFQRASMYASGVPNRMVMSVVAVLENRLNFRAESACSEKALVKNSSLMERIKTAERGSKNNARIKKLGRIKSNSMCEEPVIFFMIKKVAGELPSRHLRRSTYWMGLNPHFSKMA